jgi:hypothetical protein
MQWGSSASFSDQQLTCDALRSGPAEAMPTQPLGPCLRLGVISLSKKRACEPNRILQQGETQAAAAVTIYVWDLCWLAGVSELCCCLALRLFPSCCCCCHSRPCRLAVQHMNTSFWSQHLRHVAVYWSSGTAEAEITQSAAVTRACTTALSAGCLSCCLLLEQTLPRTHR